MTTETELGVCITDDADHIQATGHRGPHAYSPDCWGWTSLQRAVAEKLGLPLTWAAETAAGGNEASAVTHVEDFTTWEGCGRLLDAMRERGWMFDIHAGQIGSALGVEVLFRHLDAMEVARGQSPTLPAAVLLAAAAALGVE